MRSIALQESADHERHVVGENLCYFRTRAGHRESSLAEELASSLGRDPKSIHPKFFYDRRGSELFERICCLPEYYLTRAETEILSSAKRELAGFLDGDFRLVELGSGSSIKTRHLLDALDASSRQVEYVPIDISEFLEEGASDLLERYPRLDIVGIIDTYENGLDLIKGHGGARNLIAFLGSSFGNLPFEEGAKFLSRIRDSMNGGDRFLIGLDLVKERDVLERAYDDSQGVTAEFNLNVLERINRDLGADFDTDAFSHHSVYNEKEQRVEMYLRSLREQHVEIPGADLSLRFEEGELVHTENSHKFSMPQIRSMMADAGLDTLETWTDSQGMFASVLAGRS